MKTLNTVRLIAIASAFLMCVCFANAAGVSSEAAAPGGKPAIAKGMSAAMIRQLIGEPLEVKKMAAEGARAESWIYRRNAGIEVTQEAVFLEEVYAFVGLGYGDKDNIGLVKVPALRLKHTTVTQVTALLLVEDTLMVARQWHESDVRFDN
ncbi:MAG TPA: hypothetical protein VMM36_13925 [Opitutaceae bacterium]|nr:hypothetical protein [Opitutaceae bacterium]